MAKMTGCSYGKVSRNMIDNLSADFKEFKLDIKKEFKELRETNMTLYNHLSSRVQPWVTLVLTIGGSILTGVIVWGLSK